MTVFWAQAETLVIVVMVGSSCTELLPNADFHHFYLFRYAELRVYPSAFGSKRGTPHSRESPYNKNEFRQEFLQAVFTANANFQFVSLEACLYWEQTPALDEKIPRKKFSYACQSMRL